MDISQLRDELAKCQQAKSAVGGAIDDMDFEAVDAFVCSLVELASDTGAEHAAAGELQKTHTATSRCVSL